MLEDFPNDGVAAVDTNGGAGRSASRRKRTSFSKDHVELLRSTFKTDPYPGISVRERLSQQTGIPESRIQVWFQNRRARTLKGGGAKKAPWQSNSATHDTFSPPVSNEGFQGLPPAYQTQMMQDMGNSFYYEQSPPPVYQDSQNYRPCSIMFPPHAQCAHEELLGEGMSSAPMRSCWPQQGHSQTAPATPFYYQPLLDLRDGSSTSRMATFGYPGPVDSQMYRTSSPTPPFKVHTPDSGLGDRSLETSTRRESWDSTFDDMWSAIAQENWSAQGGSQGGLQGGPQGGWQGGPQGGSQRGPQGGPQGWPQERDHRAESSAQPDLSLSDVLEVLEKDWVEGEIRKAGYS